MGSTAANQNPWTPYKDCSLGICSIYCPQFCYFIFPPPPPEDDSNSPFSPLIIAIIGVLVGAFILVSYYTIATRCCRRNPTTSVVAEDLHGGAAAAAAASGLEEAVIKTITVCKYQEGDGLIEGNECAVCLSEFQENEPLRLLPKCSHAFHLPCIDTWLKSHSNCPLCRAVVMSSAPPLPPPPPSQAPTTMNSYEFQRPRDLVIVMDDGNADRDHGNAAAGTRKESLERDEEEEGVSRHFRRSRSVSLTTLPSQRHVFDGVKGGRSWRELGSSNGNGIGVEDRSADVELVGSNSTARFMFMCRDKGKNTMLLPD